VWSINGTIPATLSDLEGHFLTKTFLTPIPIACINYDNSVCIMNRKAHMDSAATCNSEVSYDLTAG